MGLDTSHDCWHGAYGAFTRWRCKIALLAGVPLLLMEGFYSEDHAGGTVFKNALNQLDEYDVLRRWIETTEQYLPFKWEWLRPDIIHILLNHSDCDGEIAWQDCEALADRLAELMPLLDGDGGGHIGSYRDKTQQFIDGLRLAASLKENVDFH